LPVVAAEHLVVETPVVVAAAAQAVLELVQARQAVEQVPSLL
jgi:hypothetical protein